MSFTYGQLKQAIQDYAEYEESTFVANLPIFIRNAEERILKSIQLSFFRKNATSEISQGAQYIRIPGDYLASFSLSLRSADGNKFFLDMKDVNFLQEYTPNPSTEGTPRYYAQFDINNFTIAPSAETTYTAELHYFYRPNSLTAGTDNDTTWLSQNAELSLLYGALVEAYIFMKGDQDMMSYYDKRFTDSLAGLRALGEAKEVTDAYRTGMVIRSKA